MVADSLFNNGLFLDKLGKYEESLAVYDELVNEYKDYKNKEIRNRVGLALFRKGFLLGKLGRDKEATEFIENW
jgi:tetratricopeptide (TPR) repeat protein